MAKKPRKPLPERLKLALQEALAHAKGELKLKTVVIPENPAPVIKAEKSDEHMIYVSVDANFWQLKAVELPRSPV